MPHFFVDTVHLAPGNRVAISPADTSHLYRVLRLRDGAAVTVANGRGQARRAVLVDTGPGGAFALLGEEAPGNESSLRLTLFQALAKGEKMDLIIRQAVELGACRIVPLLCGRSVPRWPQSRAEHKLRRWREVVRSAAAQCRRACLPEISGPLCLEEALGLASAPLIVPWEEEKMRALADLLREPLFSGKAASLFTGPEGGFAPAEIALFRSSGAHTVHLGPRILRTETAAAAALGLIQALQGDLYGPVQCR